MDTGRIEALWEALKTLDGNKIASVFATLKKEERDVVIQKYLLLSSLLLTEEISNDDIDWIKEFRSKGAAQGKAGQIISHCLKKESFAPEEYGDGLTQALISDIVEILPLLPSLKRLSLYLKEEVDLSILFQRLGAIKVLDIASLVYQKIDPSIQLLNKLSVCTIKGCDVEAVLMNLSGLENLDHLYLSENMLKVFPSSFNGHPSLGILDLSNNLLSTIHPFPSFPVLGSIRLEDNQLHDPLPNFSDKAPRVQSLNLAHNRLTDISSLSKCQNLQNLSVEGNPLEKYPQKLGAIRSLQISSDHLKGLLPALIETTDFKILNIIGGKMPISFSVISQFRNLESLHVRDVSITDWDNIDHLQKLKSLSLVRCDIDQVGDGLWELKALESLDLHQNRISSLEDKFDKLSSLKQMNISGNRLEDLPETLLHRTSIKILYIGQNNISASHLQALKEKAQINLKG